MYLNRTLRHVSADGVGGVISGTLYWQSPISDADPPDGYVSGANAYPWAAVNVTGGDVIIDSGIGQHRYVIVSNILGAVTVTTTVNGTAVALTSGVDFTLGVNDTAPELAVTASNLAAAINANATLSAQLRAYATVTGVALEVKTSCYQLYIATNQVLRIDVVNNDDGILGLYGRVRLGKPGTPGYATGVGDIYSNSAKVEFDGAVSVGGALRFDGGQASTISAAGTWNTGGIVMAGTSQTPDTSVLLTGVLANNWILCESGDYAYDFAHPLQANPTLFIHSANQSTTEWLSLAHDQTNGVIATGKGHLSLLPVAGSSVMVPDGTAAAPGIRLTSQPSGLYYVANGIGFAANGNPAGVSYSTYFGHPGSLFAGATKDIGWTGGPYWTAASDGKAVLTNAARSTGVLFDVTTDALLKVRNRADSAYATLYAGELRGLTSVINESAKPTVATMTATAHGMASCVVHKYDWTNAMVAALGAVKSGAIAVCTLPAGTVVRNMYLKVGTAETALADLTVSVGRTGATYLDYLAAGDAKAAANTIYGDAAGERGANLTGYDLPSITATTTVYALFTTTDAGLNLADALASTGSIYIETTKLP